MQFKPRSEEECQAEQLCPEGITPFTILEAMEVASKSAKNAGKMMIKLKLNVHGDDGYDYHVYDYIADWFMAHKFRHFFYSIGRGEQYEKGEVDAALLKGAAGWVDIATQKGKGEYGPKSIAKDYCNGETPKEASAAPSAPSSAATNPDDDLPFS